MILESTVHGWRKHRCDGEVEHDQVRKVDGDQLLHLLAVEHLHVGDHDLGGAAPVRGVDDVLHVLLLQHPVQTSHPQHLRQLVLLVHVHDVGEVAQAGGTVVCVQAPVWILE